MSFSSPLRLISKPLSSARVPSSLKTAYRFLIKIPSSLEAGIIIAYTDDQMICVNVMKNKSIVKLTSNYSTLPCMVHRLQIQSSIHYELYIFY